MSEFDQLTAARRRFPVGDRVRGRVSALPFGAGRTGLFVDLGAEPGGFVDVIHLPDNPGAWPEVGREALFEVLIHRPGQVRLYPLDAGMRSRFYRLSPMSGEEWAALTRRHPPGSTAIGTVSDVTPGDRTYGVRFDDFHSFVEYDGPPPESGRTGTYTIVRQLEWTRRILVAPVP
ncbi:hypothetical protein [Actinoplanes subglobosus]|uniref:S1 motif domain-containing protein n=1 Tax=Actinoplanes subglobosus TaxID=1547892 RepID=A0ABV8IKH5_9ACTN